MRSRVAAVLLVLVAGYLAFNYFIRPIPAVSATTSVPEVTTIPGPAPVLPWPAVGQAAIGASGLGLIASSGKDTQVPAAGVAKVMTALLVLEDKPLKVGDPGPSIVITDEDVLVYLTDKAAQEPAVEVRSGEQLSEFRALQGLLVPSADNLASTLARWDAGSIAAFVAKMNKRAQALGMRHTKFADETGASAHTVTTPSDLVLLGITAMKQPVLAEIVAMTQADLPVAGTVYSLDTALGQSGIIGIQTGSGANQGASFLFAASATLGKFTITIFGCVMGQPSPDAATAAAKALIAAMRPQLQVVRVLNKDQAVGSYQLPWPDHTDLLSGYAVDLVEWPGMILTQRLRTPAIVVNQPIDPGTAEGTLHITLGAYDLDVPLTTANALYPPGRFWKLIRI